MAIISSIPQPAPGVVIIQPLPINPNEQLTLSREKANATRLTKGVVIIVGNSYQTEFDSFIGSPVEDGDEVLFLTYDSGIDTFMHNNQLYHAVLFKDIRAVL